MILTDFQEVVDRVDGNDQLIEWQVRIIFKAKVMYLCILSPLQNLFFKLFAILVFTDVPDLIICNSNMRFKVLKSILLWVWYVVESGDDLDDLYFFGDLVLEFLVVGGDFLSYLGLLQFLKDSRKWTQHFYKNKEIIKSIYITSILWRLRHQSRKLLQHGEICTAWTVYQSLINYL